MKKIKALKLNEFCFLQSLKNFKRCCKVSYFESTLLCDQTFILINSKKSNHRSQFIDMSLTLLAVGPIKWLKFFLFNPSSLNLTGLFNPRNKYCSLYLYRYLTTNLTYLTTEIFFQSRRFEPNRSL